MTAPSASATRAPGAIVIGTAGHVDHGKTALVRRLTGQDTDRLPEEQERGISIDLGFAHLELDGRRHGVVDVPGHERFVRNMLAGAHGIDLVLLVVAADDGVMPQTEEHLDIVHLLGVRDAVFVLSKCDLVDEARRREVREEVAILAAGTVFEQAPVVEVSNATGAGIDELRDVLAARIRTLPPRESRGLFRMPIDRAFALRGHGLVVTGTAIAGEIAEGDPVAVRPGDVDTRARTVQVHGERVARAGAGERVAVNLPGLEREQAGRGQVLVDPRLDFTTDRFDCWFETRGGAKNVVRSFDHVRVYAGTAEVPGRIVVLGGAREIGARERAFCQVALDDQVVVAHGDRFIVRAGAASRTSGGGVVLHPFARRHRAGESNLEDGLVALRDGALPARVHAFLELLHEFAAPTDYLAQGLSRTPAEIRAAGLDAADVVPLPSRSDPQAWTTRAKWKHLAALVVEVLEGFHAAHPLEAGMDLESTRSRLRVALPPKLFRPVVDLLSAQSRVIREESLLRLPTHSVRLEDDDAALAERMHRAIAGAGTTPPDLKQLEAMLGVPQGRLLALAAILQKEKRVVRVAPDLFYDVPAFESAKAALLDQLASRPEITVAEYRSLISASRKYALALLDLFDREALTIRVGDARRLRRG
ncbi:selenocysteine-specific translation elongation factor [bacterium]|nr:selenocysteine-specific translation elongation factor [bacterium]